MASQRMVSLLVVGLIFAANLHLSDAHVGVFYGATGDNLPAAEDVVDLLKSNNISRIRLLEPNHKVLTALKGTNIEVLLGVSNADIFPFATKRDLADIWVATNVKAYVPDLKIKYIVLGTDGSRNNLNNQFSFFAAPAMSLIYKALHKYGLTDIKVTTACDTSMLMQFEANPAPSTVNLYNESNTYLAEILPSLKQNGAPLLVNIYPYFELIKHQSEITPEFALFTSTGNVITDGKLAYQNKFDAMLDSFYTTLENLKFPDLEIVVAETGWPSAGGVAATLENENKYITNLVQHLKKGTPKRPNKPIQVYINLFDENKKGAPEAEKHFGVFTSDKKIKFPVAFNPSA